jgi:cysteine desulfurase
MEAPIYLDYQATTPVDERVLDAMLPYFRDRFGNASSRQHAYGWQAERAVSAARAQVAELVGAETDELFFTSGATEANNTVLFGYTSSFPAGTSHVVTVTTEHRAVLDPCAALARSGAEVSYLPVDERGVVDFEDLRAAITGRTRLVSVMLANNEIGTIQRLAPLIAICRERNIAFHTDVTQAAGRIPVNLRDMDVDFASFSAHKLYGPKGIGALYRRRRAPAIPLQPLLFGGGQEHGLRAGTLNVPAIVGFGRACALCHDEIPREQIHLEFLRNRFINELRSAGDAFAINGHPTDVLPGTLSIAFDGIDATALLRRLPMLALSTGSACSTGQEGPSHVLKALGLSPSRARGTVRLSFGRFSSDAEAVAAAAQVLREVRALRSAPIAAGVSFSTDDPSPTSS